MNKWQELDVNNLPPDILAGGAWEIEYHYRDEVWIHCSGANISSYKYRIRRPEPKPPTHEEQCETMALDIDSARFNYDFRSDTYQEAILKAVNFLLKESTDTPGEKKDV